MKERSRAKRNTSAKRPRAKSGTAAKRPREKRDASRNGNGAGPQTTNRSGSRPNRGISKELQAIIRVLQLSFRDETFKPRMLGAEKVAAIMRQEGYAGMTKRAVLSIQRKAIEDGLVRYYIRLPWETARVVALEQDLKRVFGLKRVLLVPGYNEMLDPGLVNLHRGIHRDVTEAMAGKVVEFLCGRMLSARRLAPDRTFQVGVAWGYTLNEVAQELLSEDRTRVKRPENTVFLPIIGTTWNDNIVAVEANSVATNCARAFGARFAHFPSPAFVPRTLADTLRQVPQIGGMLERSADCDVVITGMGPLDAIRADELRLSSDPVQNERLFAEARAAGAVGEMCFALFDELGEAVRAETHAAMGLDYEAFRRIAASDSQSMVLVVGGDRRRIHPLWVALSKARVANVLVSDTVTAAELMERAKSEGLWTPAGATEG